MINKIYKENENVLTWLFEFLEIFFIFYFDDADLIFYAFLHFMGDYFY